MPDAFNPAQPMVFKVVMQGTIADVWHEIMRTDSPIPAFFNSQMHVQALKAGSKLAMAQAMGNTPALSARF